jgi:ABC-2 type transport system ATP-binding protein
LEQILESFLVCGFSGGRYMENFQVLVVESLKKSYGEVKAVRGISFTVNRGEVFGLLGPNGAGKTTTVEAIVGLIRRDEGQVLLLGMDPQESSFLVKSRIGVQLQVVNLFPRLTVLETLQLFGAFYTKRLSEWEILDMVGLSEKARSLVEKLSGGQLKRLSVGLALIGDGEVIFLDEPTSGLDPQSRRNLWEIILSLRKHGKTVFLTTHYLDEAEKLCDRVAIMDHGEIIALGRPRDLIAEHFQEKAIEIPRLMVGDVALLSSLPGVNRVSDDDEKITLYTRDLTRTFVAMSSFAEKKSLALDNVVVREATLEDVFLKLAGRRIRE